MLPISNGKCFTLPNVVTHSENINTDGVLNNSGWTNSMQILEKFVIEPFLHLDVVGLLAWLL